MIEIRVAPSFGMIVSATVEGQICLSNIEPQSNGDNPEIYLGIYEAEQLLLALPTFIEFLKKNS